MTVHGRMMWGLSLLSLFTLGAAFAIISLVLDRYQEHQLDSALLQVARTEAEEAPGNNFAFSQRPGPAANDVGPLNKFGIIFDGQGRVLSATPPFDTSPPGLSTLGTAIDSPFDFSFGTEHLRGVIVPIPGYPAYRVLLAASRDDLDGDSRFLRRAMIGALALAMIWMVGATGWLVRRTMREHERIAQILHRIAVGDLGARVAGEVSDQDLRRVGSDVDEIAQRLDRLVGHQRRFIAHAAHELRSPLAALHGEIQQALRKERSAEEYQQALAFALRASRRLSQLADDLLELARAERSACDSEPVALETVLAEVIDSIEPLAREKGVTLTRAPTACVARALPTDVERILRNLIDNAIRHSPAGAVVRLEAEAGSMVSVKIRDQGPGVATEDQQRVFEPFYRSPANRAEARGAGLGLAIARELARKHGGDVVVGDAGNCFVMSLPAWRSS